MGLALRVLRLIARKPLSNHGLVVTTSNQNACAQNRGALDTAAGGAEVGKERLDPTPPCAGVAGPESIALQKPLSPRGGHWG